MVTGGT